MMEAAYISWHQRRVVRVFSALASGCLVYAAFVAAVVAMVSRFAWAAHFWPVWTFFTAVQRILNKSGELKRAQPVSWGSFWRLGESEGVYLAVSSSLLFFASKRSVFFVASTRSVWTDPEIEVKPTMYHVPGVWV